MRTDEEVLSQFGEWAKNNELVRAAVLTSSRVDPSREIDFLSDYDIELYVSDLTPFKRDDAWLSDFGPIMVRWPLKPRSTFQEGWITRLILFKDGVRIDFQITDQLIIHPDAYGEGYMVLVDKDDLTSDLAPPTYAKYIIRKPTRGEYDDRINAFWWDVAYVPKYLWRDELPMAAYMMGEAVRGKFLREVIEWHIGLVNEWSVNTGLHGKWFKHFLSDEIWVEYESTFAGADIEDHWAAFFNAVSLFSRLAKGVGDGLGYAYPTQLDQEMTDYYMQIRNTQK